MNRKIVINIVVFVVLFAILLVLIKINYNDVDRKQALENTVLDIAGMNEKSVFSIDKIYLYSSAYAINKDNQKAIWDLNLYQYTDIAIYLNNSVSSQNGENVIKELSIDDIKFNNLTSGTPNLYYKNLQEFGKFSLLDNNIINSTTGLNYEVTKNDVDYTKPQISTLTDNPITLEYVNSNLKDPCVLTDIDNPLIYDGSLLKRCSVQLSSITCNISFKIHITNELGYKYVTTVYIDVPLTGTSGNSSIYSGNITKELTNKVSFFREQ